MKRRVIMMVLCAFVIMPFVSMPFVSMPFVSMPFVSMPLASTMFYTPSVYAEDVDDRQIMGNYGVDCYFYVAINSGFLKIDHVYLAGFLGRDGLRSLGWPAIFLSDGMDIYRYSDEATIFCYYRSDGHCCVALFLGDLVK